jgi:hypothetical protein
MSQQLNMIKDGLDFICSHLEQPIWPRRVAVNEVYQEVYSEREAIDLFISANFKQCFINAYPSHTEWNGLIRQSPSLLFFDLDNHDVIDMVLKRIDSILHGVPTVIESGHGLHILQPVKSPILEDVFIRFTSKFNRPSDSFLKFVEKFLSDGHTDSGHNPTLNSCMLRIPGSFNDDKEVRVTRVWNKERPSVLSLMRPFLRNLMELELKTKQSIFLTTTNQRRPREWRYIEWLLRTPIDDGRDIAIWLILSPYLINIKKLSFEQAYDVIMEWLDRCDSLRKVGSGFKSIVRYRLRYAQRTGFLPLFLHNVSKWSKPLADKIIKEYVMTKIVK